VDSVAEQCVGYGGADLKALCTEASLRAIRRKYPQIYSSDRKLLIDVNSIRIRKSDFHDAMQAIVPSSHRSSLVVGKPLTTRLTHLLDDQLSVALTTQRSLFPLDACNKSNQANDDSVPFDFDFLDMDEEEEEKKKNTMEVEEKETEKKLPTPNSMEMENATEGEKSSVSESPLPTGPSVKPSTSPTTTTAVETTSVQSSTEVTTVPCSTSSPSSPSSSSLEKTVKRRVPKPLTAMPFRPRMLVHGPGGRGQSLIGSALLHELEEYPMYSLDLPSIYGDASSKNAEETLVRLFKECQRNSPSLLYWPHIDIWWETAYDSLQTTLLLLLDSLSPDEPVFLLATSDAPLEDLPAPLRDGVFHSGVSSNVLVSNPSELARRKYFETGFVRDLKASRPSPPQPKALSAPELPLAPVVSKKKKTKKKRKLNENGEYEEGETEEEEGDEEEELSPEQKQAIREREDACLTKLRMFIRGLLNSLSRQFPLFAEPVDVVEVPDYYDVILQPIAVSDMQTKNNTHKYLCIRDLLTDVDLLVSNAKEYNLPDTATGRNILNNVYHFQDTVLNAVSLFNAPLAKECEVIAKKRVLEQASQKYEKERGEEEKEEEGEEEEKEKNASAAHGTPEPRRRGTRHSARLSPSMQIERENEKFEALGASAVESSSQNMEMEPVERGEGEDKKVDRENERESGKEEEEVSSANSSEREREREAARILKEYWSREVVLDLSEVDRLCSLLVSKTANKSVNEIEMVTFRLFRCIASHQNEWDKTALLEEMNQIISCL